MKLPLGGRDHAQRLYRIVEAIIAQRCADAERCVAHLFDAIRDDEDPAAVTYSVFGAALARRLSPETAEQANLYLRRFEVPQIRLFNLLAHEVPQVGLTTIIANRCIAKALAEQSEHTIIDIGIGTGRQMTSLLHLMAAQGCLPRRVTMIGIEPSARSLAQAEDNVRSAARELGVELDFHPVCRSVERLDDEDWASLGELCRTRPAINGSFAFHHIADVDGRDVRNDVFLRLRTLNPLALVLSEPNVHHLEPDFGLRFANCWHHFRATFEVIDALPIKEQQDKDALKACFFGREIADILGTPEHMRSERHESSASWLRRLAETGFVPCLDVQLPPPGPVIRATARNGYATLDYDHEPLVAVLAAAPANDRFDALGALARATGTP